MITFKIVFQCLQIEEKQMINSVALLFTFRWSSFTILFVTITSVAELQWEHNSVEAYGLKDKAVPHSNVVFAGHEGSYLSTDA